MIPLTNPSLKLIKTGELEGNSGIRNKNFFLLDAARALITMGTTSNQTIGSTMTICIAAICEDGKNLVVAADRMFTVGHPLNVEFEPPISKIEAMGNGCVAMGAGNGLFVNEILRKARESYQNADSAPIHQIATAVLAAYTSHRDEKIDESIIRATLGPDFVAFKNRGGTLPAYLQPQPGIYQQLVVQTNQFNLGIDIIIAGVDTTGSHIYYIGHPGTIISFNKIGYNTIGSGATHAAVKFSVGLQHPKLSLSDTLFSVYSAKKLSEVAPGVGLDTEMKIISEGEVWPVPEEIFKKLSELLKKEEVKPSSEQIKTSYEQLREAARTAKAGK